jgi:hypothetical protein
MMAASPQSPSAARGRYGILFSPSVSLRHPVDRDPLRLAKTSFLRLQSLYATVFVANPNNKKIKNHADNLSENYGP